MVNSKESLSRIMQLDRPFAAAVVAAGGAVMLASGDRGGVRLEAAKSETDEVWPSPAGRAWLREATSLGLAPTRTLRGELWASVDGWRLHSAKDSLFRDPQEGKRRLAEWARVHTAHADQLSARRALILDTGSDGHRLWQLGNAQSTLRERLDAALSASIEVLGRELERVAEHLLEAESSFRRSGLRVRSNLWTVSGDLGQRPRFVGLMPVSNEDAPLELQGAALLERELGPALRELSRVRADYPWLRSVLRKQADHSLARRTLRVLA